MRLPFGGLEIGARFLYEGEPFTKVEHELREGMLHCSNAVSDSGRWLLVDDEEQVQVRTE